MRIWLCLAAALVVIAGCDVPGTASANPSPARTTPSPSPIASPSPSPRPSPTPIPEPTPVVFIQFTQSDYGAIGILTQPGAVCQAGGNRPDGSAIGGVQNPKTAGPDGTVSWTYPQTATATGTGVHNVVCSWNGQNTGLSAPFQVGA